MWNSGRVFNPICRVNFAGFESDTYTLQKAGWQISAEQMVTRNAVRLALRFEPARLYALTGYADVCDYLSNPSSFESTMVFNVQHMCNDMRVQIIASPRAFSFAPIDAEPVYTEYREEYRFSDLVPFRALSTEAPEIVIAPENLNEIMEAVLKMQDPKQREIRERRRKEEWRNGGADRMPSEGYNPVRDIRAQIITLAS